ncbi:MAG: ABC transporter ATP-binding protein [Acidobacteriota bacterium]|nr:ABC transporter ATP-binding protein [Acidobacteriota bacterium]
MPATGNGLSEKLVRLVRIYRRFAPLLRQHRLRILAAGVAMLGVIAAGLAAPWPLQAVIDGVLLNRRADGLVGLLRRVLPDSPTAMLLTCSAMIVVLAALRGALSYVQMIQANTVGHRVVSNLRVDLFARLQRLSLTFHARQRTGDLLVRLTGDVSMLREVLLPALLDLASRLLIVVGMLTLMALMDPRLTLIAVALIPLLVLASSRFGRRIRAATRSQRKKEGRLAAVAGEALGAVPMVQAFSGESAMADRFATQNRRSLRAGLRTLRLQESLSRIVEVSLALGSASVLFVGARQCLAGMMSPGELIVFLAYLKGLYRPIQGSARLVARFNKAIACGERVLEVLDSSDEVADAPGAVEARHIRGEIVFDSVTFGYDPDRPVLEDVSFTIPAGSRFGIAGPSGEGKSTILALLLRLYEPQQGRILIDGKDIRDYTVESYRRQIAIVLQEPFLFGISARENILFGRPEASDEEVREAARQAGADAFLSRLPEGYDSLLDERGGSLSRGQAQRVAIARAVLRRAPILVLDEAMTGLDAQSEKMILATLRRLSRGHTSVWIAHRLDHILGCDRIIVLRNGKVVQQGRPRDLLFEDGAMKHLFRETG